MRWELGQSNYPVRQNQNNKKGPSPTLHNTATNKETRAEARKKDNRTQKNTEKKHDGRDKHLVMLFAIMIWLLVWVYGSFV